MKVSKTVRAFLVCWCCGVFLGFKIREFKVSVGAFRLHHKKVFVVSGLGFRVWGFNLRALDFGG